ncbi:MULTISPECIES: hypothetical protein [Hymenobacter]|uniref:Uncharacterized protein n=1 Tax=Hymenobacter mucosus TaxID=1411120 RepID=A0A238X7M1_9BACT|nr:MULTISPECIES: hypothetical protein [Hymenobacter]SNR54543.1 hypothetical protein SAMN06269173_103543 [Hymenobacter mucosus]
MKIVFAFVAALALGVSAASAQTTPTQSTPTVNGSMSPQSSPPAQPANSVGTLPASNTQPASDMRSAQGVEAAQRRADRKMKKDMEKPRTKKSKMKSSTTTTSPQ